MIASSCFAERLFRKRLLIVLVSFVTDPGRALPRFLQIGDNTLESILGRRIRPLGFAFAIRALEQALLIEHDLKFSL